MARTPVLNAQKIAKAHAMRKRNVTYAKIAAELGISVGSVAKALKMKPAKPAPKKRPRRAAGRSSKSKEPQSVTELLKRQVKALERIGDGLDDDVSAFTAVTRAINQTVGLLGKLEPPEPDDPEAAPDMQAAAARARTKLLDAVARAEQEHAA
jgi:predicted transcriptional regulator